MNQFDINYERLRRKIESCEKSYDQIELFDLSHSLRMWAELKTDLTNIKKDAVTHMHFKTASPPKAVSRILNSAESVYYPAPGGVLTYAANGHISDLPSNAQPDGSTYYSCINIMPLETGSGMLAKDYIVVKRSLSDSEKKIISNSRVKRCNYIQWLGSEIIRLTTVDDNANLVKVALSREQIIKRMANAFGASHTWSNSNDYENSYDKYIRELFHHQVLGLPLPYLLLLNIGRNIINEFEKYTEHV